MKKVASILIAVFVFTFTMEAQKMDRNKKPQLTVDQQANLAVKKMTLSLDLSDKQQNQILPLIKQQAANRMAAKEKRNALKENNTKPTADEMYAMKSKQLDTRIAFKRDMKKILSKEQFEKFEAKSKRNFKKGKKMMKQRGKNHKGKNQKGKRKGSNRN